MIARLTSSRGTSEYRVGEIFISATPETSAEARANAQRIVQQVRAARSSRPSPGNSRRLRPRRSAATSAGSMAALPPELADLVTRMPVGAISEPIEVPGGFSVVYLVDLRQVLVADARDAVLSLMQLSVELPAGTAPAQAQARAQQLATATQSMGGQAAPPRWRRRRAPS